MASSSSHYPADKFESLNLPPVWESAAAHVDYQLSDPEASSYRSEMAATWRSLQPITQRSYIVVAVKKAEAQVRKRPGRRVPSAAEAHMILLNNVFELLWVTPNPNAGARKPRKAASKAQIVSSDTSVDANSTATLRPLSPAWYCIADAGRRVPERLCLNIAACEDAPSRPSRRPVSPLARFAPVTAAQEDSMDAVTNSFRRLSYSDESDTGSDWSGNE